ncbi:MAG: hypothetical protein WC606_02600 [Candidatus Absconditabacterales bacterium]
MASRLGKFVKKGKEKFTQRDSKLNFVIPENIIKYYGFHGKKDDRELEVDEDNFRFQIGKMDKGYETIYSQENIAGGLEYLIKKTGYNKKVVIQLRPDLARFLCNEDQKEKLDSIMTFEEEKRVIETLIKKYFRKNADKIQIVNVSDQYPELFELIEKRGRKGLEAEGKPILDKQNFSAVKIAQYLYRCCQKNKQFMQLIYNTKSKEQRNKDTRKIGENQSDYYALVEIAIRMYEVLKGIHIQGGVDRQMRYDHVISGIIYGYKTGDMSLKYFPELAELHAICQEVAPQVEFEKIYVPTKEIKEIENKKTEKNILMKKIVAYTSLALAATLFLTAGYKLSEYNQKKAQEEKNKAFLQKSLESKTSNNVYFDTRGKNKMPSLEPEINEAADDFYNDFIQIYGAGKANQQDLDVLKKLMKQYFLQADSNGVLVNIDKVYSPFMNAEKLHRTLRVFVSEYAQFLTESGFDIISQPAMQKHADACKYTLELQGNIQADFSEATNAGEPTFHIAFDSTQYQKEFNALMDSLGAKGPLLHYPPHTFNIERYGHYLHSNGKHYDVLIVQSYDNKDFLLASERETGQRYFDAKQLHTYTKSNGELVSKDFLENWIVK